MPQLLKESPQKVSLKLLAHGPRIQSHIFLADNRDLQSVWLMYLS